MLKFAKDAVNVAKYRKQTEWSKWFVYTLTRKQIFLILMKKLCDLMWCASIIRFYMNLTINCVFYHYVAVLLSRLWPAALLSVPDLFPFLSRRLAQTGIEYFGESLPLSYNLCLLQYLPFSRGRTVGWLVCGWKSCWVVCSFYYFDE